MDPRYPIGTYQPLPYSHETKQEWLADIRFLPQAIEAAIINLDEQQLHTPYRDGGWTVHQLVHHVADSHMNAFIRFKLGYTEEHPTIKPYNEDAWVHTAELPALPVNISITLLYALHHRWSAFLDTLTDTDWDRTVFHPESRQEMTLWYLLGMYAWHSRHHVAHITALRQAKGW